jgi:hypothetical protein
VLLERSVMPLIADGLLAVVMKSAGINPGPIVRAGRVPAVPPGGP